MIQFNQIRCYSCGAGLLKTDGLCKCQYCRNINLIRNGKTEIVYMETNTILKPQKISKTTQFLVILCCVIFPITGLKYLPYAPYAFGKLNPKTKVRLANGAIIEI